MSRMDEESGRSGYDGYFTAIRAAWIPTSPSVIFSDRTKDGSEKKGVGRR